MSNFSAFKDAISSAREVAKREAERDCGRGFIMSRGMFLQGSFAKDSGSYYGEAESISYGGGKAELEALVRHAKLAGAVDLRIVGGFNFAESLVDYKGGEYDPFVSEWEVMLPDELTNGS